MSPEQKDAIVAAAREWLADQEGQLLGAASRALALAVIEAFPEDQMSKDNCACDEQDECDECPSRAEVDASIAILRVKVDDDVRIRQAYLDGLPLKLQDNVTAL